METVAGIFETRARAEEAVRQLHSLGIPNDRIALLTPGMSDARVERAVPTEDSEAAGIGQALGGTVGGAMGVAGGASLGAAAASLLVPGVGPVLAGAILGAALLGAGGAAAGLAVGGALEKELESGLPRDELYVYEHALRKGESVVIGFLEDEAVTYAAQGALANAGATSIDEARENWWVGLRDAEALEYETQDRNFAADEADYRRGFEAALQAGKEGHGLKSAVQSETNEAFRCGYERGAAYKNNVQENYRTYKSAEEKYRR